MLPLQTAQNYASRITTWLSPYCDLLQVAGSIRRQRPQCGDIDLVIIPKTEPVRDLLGETTGTRNLCLEFLRGYIEVTAGTKFLTGFESDHSTIVQLPKCQLDLFWSDSKTWATRLLCRTGSKDHNIWLAQRANDRHMHWTPNQGLHTLPGHPEHPKAFPCATEPEIYAHLGLKYLDPLNRELPYFSKHIDSGL